MKAARMHWDQILVLEFHERLGLTVGTEPGLREVALARAILTEEFGELMVALDAHDLVQVANELCDVVYASYSAALRFGLDLEPLLAAIHRNNLATHVNPADPVGKPIADPQRPPVDLGPLVSIQSRRDTT